VRSENALAKAIFYVSLSPVGKKDGDLPSALSERTNRPLDYEIAPDQKAGANSFAIRSKED
jgi:hypothetical protein